MTKWKKFYVTGLIGRKSFLKLIIWTKHVTHVFSPFCHSITSAISQLHRFVKTKKKNPHLLQIYEILIICFVSKNCVFCAVRN